MPHTHSIRQEIARIRGMDGYTGNGVGEAANVWLGASLHRIEDAGAEIAALLNQAATLIRSRAKNIRNDFDAHHLAARLDQAAYTLTGTPDHA